MSFWEMIILENNHASNYFQMLISTVVLKMCIKFSINNFYIGKIIINIVSGNLFPVLTNPSI